jgi:hypothetical protein
MTDSATVSVQAGPYVVGEIPPPLQYQFLDSDGLPLNLLGFTAKFICREQNGAPVTYTATFADAASGIAQFAWTGGEFPTSGSYLAEFWAGNGTNRYASILIRFSVRTAVGPVPSV